MLKNRNQSYKFVGLNLNKVIKSILIILPLGVIGNLLFSYFTFDKNSLHVLNQFPVKYFFLSLPFCFIPWFTHTFRMMIWLRFLNQSLPFKEILKIAIGTDLGAAVTPTSVGGGPLKAGMLIQQGLKPGTAISLTVLGSVEDYAIFFLSIPFALLYSGNSILADKLSQIDGMRLLLVFVGLCLLVLSVFLILKKDIWHLRQKFEQWSLVQKFKHSISKIILDIIKVYRLIGNHGKWLLVLAIFINFIHWTAKFSVIIILFHGLGLSVNPVQLYLLQWVVYLLTLFIPTPGAAGGAEASFYFIFKSIISESFISFVIPVWRILTYYLQLGLGTIIFCWLTFHPGKKLVDFLLRRTTVEKLRLDYE